MPFHVLISIFFGSSYSLNEIRDSDRHTNIVFDFKLFVTALFSSKKQESRAGLTTLPHLTKGAIYKFFQNLQQLARDFTQPPLTFVLTSQLYSGIHF